MRGTIPQGETQGVHLLAAYLPAEGLVLMPVAVGQQEGDLTAAPHLLELLDLRQRVVRGDAAFTQQELSAQIIEAGGYDVCSAKENQPELLIQDVFDPAPQPWAGARSCTIHAQHRRSTVVMVVLRSAP